MRGTTSAAAALMLVLVNVLAWGGDPPTLGERAAAIEQASRAPDGERVVAGHVSRALQLSVETLRTERLQTGLGWGELLIAHRLAKEGRLAFDAVVAEFRHGKTWEQIALDHTVNMDKLGKEIQGSQEMVERRSEDGSPQRLQLENDGLKPSPGPPLPKFDTPPSHRH